MRVSRLMLVTLRDTPSEAEIISHQLLLRGGYIRRVASGIYAYLPLMWRVLRKITEIVREEMDATGALETLLPQLQPSELWQDSGRWQGYTAAGEGIMFHLKDRQNRELALGPTHEEVVTSLGGDLIRSYRQLPITLYQIQTKFRDEIRPRFGLMRSREFIMKDAYSFHSDEQSLKSTYKNMDIGYKNIFARCGLDVLAVDADSGAIGGAASQEFMVKANAGEDLILTSQDGKYSANQEKATSFPKPPIPYEIKQEKLIETPNQGSIESLCNANNLDPSQVVKVLVLLANIENDEYQPLLISLRGDQDLNEIKLKNVITNKLRKQILEIKAITQKELKEEGLNDLPFGFIGPDLNNHLLKGAKKWNQEFLRLVDHSASSLNNFVCGSNNFEKHRIGMSWEKLEAKNNIVDIRMAKAGDFSIKNKNQLLEETRGIEVGHIFQLGKKYSLSLETNFTNKEGSLEPFWMGCYGIGISRLAQAAVEQHHDDEGICWPISIAPFEVIIVVANQKDKRQVDTGEELYKELTSKGLEVLLDDRPERAGVKFKDADLIGIPLRIVVGRDLESGQIELFHRITRSSKLLPIDEALREIQAEIFNGRS